MTISTVSQAVNNDLDASDRIFEIGQIWVVTALGDDFITRLATIFCKTGHSLCRNKVK